jgi:hypothetical protein
MTKIKKFMTTAIALCLASAMTGCAGKNESSSAPITTSPLTETQEEVQTTTVPIDEDSYEYYEAIAEEFAKTSFTSTSYLRFNAGSFAYQTGKIFFISGDGSAPKICTYDIASDTLTENPLELNDVKITDCFYNNGYVYCNCSPTGLKKFGLDGKEVAFADGVYIGKNGSIYSISDSAVFLYYSSDSNLSATYLDVEFKPKEMTAPEGSSGFIVLSVVGNKFYANVTDAKDQNSNSLYSYDTSTGEWTQILPDRYFLFAKNIGKYIVFTNFNLGNCIFDTESEEIYADHIGTVDKSPFINSYFGGEANITRWYNASTEKRQFYKVKCPSKTGNADLSNAEMLGAESSETLILLNDNYYIVKNGDAVSLRTYVQGEAVENIIYPHQS